MNTKAIYNRTYDRVKWWVNDAAFKPPEIDWEHYYECMAQDVANTAAGKDIGNLSAISRLDP